MATSGKLRAQPARLMTELIADPALRNNFEQVNKSTQALHALASSRNFTLSEAVAIQISAAGKVTNLEATIQTSGRPIIAALVPATLAKANALIPTQGSYLGLLGKNATTPLRLYAQVELYKDQAPVFKTMIEASWSVGSLLNYIRYPAFTFFGFDAAPAGKYRYEIYVTSLPVDGTIIFGNVQLLLMEW